MLQYFHAISKQFRLHRSFRFHFITFIFIANFFLPPPHWKQINSVAKIIPCGYGYEYKNETYHMKYNNNTYKLYCFAAFWIQVFRYFIDILLAIKTFGIALFVLQYWRNLFFSISKIRMVLIIVAAKHSNQTNDNTRWIFYARIDILHGISSDLVCI